MTAETFLNGRIVLHCGDSRDVLKTLPDNSIDSFVTDPPYALVSIVKRFGGKNAAAVKVPEGGSGAYSRASAGFMGKSWDTGETAFAVEFWAECLRVLKPGGHVVAFSGTRTVHRMVCAIEDAGFEIRDSLYWHYGSGFPKSHDVSKGIDKAAGAVREVKRHVPRAETSGTMLGSSESRPWIEKSRETGFHEVAGDIPVTNAAREWAGWGTALKPATEPICLARKPLIGTVATNVLKYGTGALNIDGTRIGTRIGTRTASTGEAIGGNVAMSGANYGRVATGETTVGRWPANILHDGSDEVISSFPDSDGSPSGPCKYQGAPGFGGGLGGDRPARGYDDEGSAARFFYTAKADAEDRLGSKHPTVKPVNLMQWLCRLVTPPGGTVIDCFAGTGTTGEAAWREGFNAILIEREPEYQEDIRRRMALCMAGPEERKRESTKAKFGDVRFEEGSLFADLNPPVDPDTPPSDEGGRSTESSRTNDRTNRNETLEASEQP